MSITAPEIMCEPISRPFSITAMVISPGPWPVSSLRLLMSWRRRSAPASDAGPAPTNRTSTSKVSRSMFSIVVCRGDTVPEATGWSRKWRVPEAPGRYRFRCRTEGHLMSHFFGFGGQRRHDLEQIADDAVIGDLEDRSLGVFVDLHDGARAFHSDDVLDCAGDADGQVKLRRDGLSRRPDLAVHRQPFVVADRARGG